MPSSMETGVKQVHIVGTDGQVPMQVASQLTPQDKTLVSVTVAAGGSTNFTANAVDMDGFNTVGVGVTADASHAWNLNVFPSPDGSILISPAAVVQSSTSTTKGGSGTCPLAYAVYQIVNNDAVTRTYNAWTRKMNL